MMVYFFLGFGYFGEYFGFIELGICLWEGVIMGLDYFKELGIMYVYFIFVFDYCLIDEIQKRDGQYNWGYDLFNYNVFEGSYLVDFYDGQICILEFKQMVKFFYDNGICVIMDVVYNYMGQMEELIFNQFVFGYYYC